MSKYHNDDVLHISSLEIMVKDINTALNFYQNILGFKLIEQANNKYFLGTKDKVLLTLIENKDALTKGKTTGLYHFAILLPKRSDLGNLLYNFIVNEFRIEGGSDHGVSEAIYFSDSEGNGIEVYVDKDESLWPIDNDSLEMVSKPLDYLDLVNSRESDLAFVMPEKAIIGHLHFHVSNLEKAKYFFIDILGFNLLQSMHSALFVSDAKYHHHIGMNVWNGVNIENRLNNMVGLVSYYLNVSSDKQINFLKTLKQNDIKVIKENNSRYFYDINNVKVYF